MHSRRPRSHDYVGHSIYKRDNKHPAQEEKNNIQKTNKNGNKNPENGPGTNKGEQSAPIPPLDVLIIIASYVAKRDANDWKQFKLVSREFYHAASNQLSFKRMNLEDYCTPWLPTLTGTGLSNFVVKQETLTKCSWKRPDTSEKKE
ncbi:hypothetical protein CJ030_MR1G011835 [Morella rubra]|uniref:Uncharacterized protein n=1 Tax=Morella rubra TaxID=262757 RepID=A0A6A1WNN2_9ROSI|nr:hypothetical protein CJ030_MR1G011835 [Morella rubra]